MPRVLKAPRAPATNGTASLVESLRASVQALQSQNAALRQLVAIHDRLGALVLQGADVEAITQVLANVVGRRVLLLDALLQVTAMALPAADDPRLLPAIDEAPPHRRGGQARGTDDAFTWAPGEGYVRTLLAALAHERRPLRLPPMADLGVDVGCVLAPVAVGDSILGYLAIVAESEDGAVEDLELQIVHHAATVYALSMMRERMAVEVARQLKDELFEGLLLGRTQDEQVARERAMRLGYNPDLSYRVLALVAYDESEDAARPELVARRRRRLLESLAELCARRAPGCVAGLREDELVVLVPEAEHASSPEGITTALELGKVALRQAAALLPAWQVSAGVGGRCQTASAIARSYAQARRALETGRRFGRRGEVIAFEDLGLYRLLFHVSDPAELRGFVDQVLGPLLDYDQRHNADFVHTLDVFLANNGNLQATARELSLHVNSVTYRLQRIQSITTLDLEAAEDRLLAQVALKILHA